MIEDKKMCHVSCIVFGVLNLRDEDIKGKKVIEIGSYDVNGSLRSIIESLEPAEYMGVDIIEGPCVDEVCSVEDLLDRFENESFDVVISTEVIEHVKDWQKAISNIKKICKKDGIIFLTTRSYGFPYHPTPTDYWRFEKEDMKQIFSDCEILNLEDDNEFPGVLIKARKPEEFLEEDLTNYKLYSVILDKRTSKISDEDYKNLHFIKINLKERFRLFKNHFMEKI
ncbi:MAG: class I SAM-dependent methyltransferase [Methanobacterium sp.]